MKKFSAFLDEAGRCWPGYKPVPGKKPYTLGSCRKEEVEQETETLEEKGLGLWTIICFIFFISCTL